MPKIGNQIDVPFFVPYEKESIRQKAEVERIYMEKMWEHLARVNSHPFDVLFLGDSLTEGYYSTSDATRWINIVSSRMRKMFNGGGIFGGEGYIPIWHTATPPGPPQRWTFGYTAPAVAAATYTDYGFGLGRRAMFLAQGQYAEGTFYGDRFWIAYTSGNVGRMAIRIDDGPEQYVDTFGPLCSGRMWDTGQLQRGYHKIRMYPSPGGAHPEFTTVVPDGIMVFDGDGGAALVDSGRGVRMWDGGRAGANTASFSVSRNWMQPLDVMSPNLIFIALGINDMAQAVSVATFKANYQTIITNLKLGVAGGIGGELVGAKDAAICIVVEVNRSDKTAAQWAPYITAMYELAAANNCMIIDLDRLLSNPPPGGTQVPNLWTDAAHPNDSGAMAMADGICTVLFNFPFHNWVNAADIEISRRKTAVASRIFNAGHSLAAGGGASSPDRGWESIFAGMLRAEDYNISKGGAVLGWHERGATGDGGYANLVRNIPIPPLRTTYKGAWVAANAYNADDIVKDGANLFWLAKVAVAANSAAPAENATWTQLTSSNSPGSTKYMPIPYLPIIWYGNNDLGWGKDLAPFINVLRYALCVASAAQIFDDDHPSHTYSAGTPARLTAGIASTGFGTGFRNMNGAAGEYAEIELQPDFPGGSVDLMFVMSPNSTGRLDMMVDTVAHGSMDFRTGVGGLGNGVFTYTPAGATQNNAAVYRFRNLAPGTHKLRITIGVVTANVYYDGYIIEASPVPTPVLCPGLVKFNATGYQTWTAPYPTDADVDTWNTAIRNLINAEFPNVYFMDFATLGVTKDMSLVHSDNVHPNDRGHAKLAAYAFDSMFFMDWTTEQIAAITRETHTGYSFYRGYSASGGNYTCKSPYGIFIPVVFGVDTVEGAVVAQPGDLLQIVFQGMWSNGPDTALFGYVDLAVMRNGTIVYGLNADAPLASLTGNGSHFANPNGYYAALPHPVFYRVRAEDMLFGTTTLRLYACTSAAAGYAGTGRLMFTANPKAALSIVNLGASQPSRGPNWSA